MTDSAPTAADSRPSHVRDVARQLRNVRNVQREQRPDGGGVFPHRDRVTRATLHLTQALFPKRIGSFVGSAEAEDSYVEQQLATGLELLIAELENEADHWEADSGETFEPGHVDGIAKIFVAALPRVRILIDTDIEAAFLGDPAARSIEEILISYPGAHAILWHRIAHELHRLGFPIVARIMSEAANERTGIDIHPGAQIGLAFFIDHGSGVVVGETTKIGSRVRLYQQVTLGARAPDGKEAGLPRTKFARHPIIGDDVVIYAGATILGAVTIGAGSVIGGNCWILHDVPENAVVQPGPSNVLTGKAAAIARDQLIGSAAFK